MPSPARSPSDKHASTPQTRTTRDAQEELGIEQEGLESHSGTQTQRPPDPLNPYDPATNDTVPRPRRHSFTRKLLHLHDGADDFEASSHLRRRSTSGHGKSRSSYDTEDQPLIPAVHNGSERKKGDGETPISKPGLGPRPVGGHHKLGTFSGVFVPTCLNVLSILMFLRFGFILGQGGVLGIMGSFKTRRTMTLC